MVLFGLQQDKGVNTLAICLYNTIIVTQ